MYADTNMCVKRGMRCEGAAEAAAGMRCEAAAAFRV